MSIVRDDEWPIHCSQDARLHVPLRNPKSHGRDRGRLVGVGTLLALEDRGLVVGTTTTLFVLGTSLSSVDENQS